jgi:NDP-sugar pyrophosphorylase family protein
VSWLANRLLAAGELVAAYPHQAPWIDVNDLAAVQRAEQLLSEHAEAFEAPGATLDQLSPGLR